MPFQKGNTLGRKFKPGHRAPQWVYDQARKRMTGKTGHEAIAFKTGVSHKADGRVVIMCPGHPRSNIKGQVLRAYLVMERKIGRYLKRGEVVHHADGNKTNDSPENLGLFNNLGEHKSFHAFLKRLNEE